MEIGVGASTWASGSQVCTGTAGSLITKPTNNSRKAHQPTEWPRNSECAKGEFGNCASLAQSTILKVWLTRSSPD